MNTEFWNRLQPIGFNPQVVQRLAQLDTEGSPMRVVEVHRDSVLLHDGERTQRAQVLPRLARALPGAAILAVGDWVLAQVDGFGATWVVERMEPVTQIARRTDDGTRQVLVSNVDTALLVMGLDGDFNLRRLERYLAMVQAAAVWPVVVLTKRDQPDTVAGIEATRARIPPDIPVTAVDARTADAGAALTDYLTAGQTLVLLGSSGAGKSTLTNTLLGAAVQDTGAVRADDSRGRHTTTTRTLFQLPGGACIVDTPGLRGLQADLDAAGLDASFTDIAVLAARCRFRDCTHRDEPDCAVRDGIAADRLANYHKLRREIRRETMTPLDRRRQLAEWKARSRGAELRVKMKRG